MDGERKGEVVRFLQEAGLIHARGQSPLELVYLTGADLAGANLRLAPLVATSLAGADLRGTDLAAAELEGADLTGADRGPVPATRSDRDGLRVDVP